MRNKDYLLKCKLFVNSKGERTCFIAMLAEEYVLTDETLVSSVSANRI